MCKVLFSTLGMTDPIKNDYDGPLLHIMRHYRPQRVYLFMTKRVCELADKDDRYRVQVVRLCEREGFTCEIIERRYEEIDNPQQFDIFYPIFEWELKNIYHENPGCELLINLSSGTPQMKSTCHLLALTASFPVIPIQVTTPNESENYGTPVFDIERTWNDNIDNHPELEPQDRTHLVAMDNLRYQILREAAISNIAAYNYAAALNILKTVPDFVPQEIIWLLTAAQHRKNMALNEAEKESAKAHYDMFPIKSGDAKELFEYLLLLGIQQKNGQLMDFLRGISPALSRLLESFLDRRCNRQIKKNFCLPDRNDRNHWRIIREKIARNDQQLLVYYDSKYVSGFRDSDLSCAVLLPIIEYDCGPQGKYSNEKVVEKARHMRMVEEKLRNSAAHNIVAIKEEHFMNIAGISSQKLLRDMQWLFRYTYQEYFTSQVNPWESYENMNVQIIDGLKADRYRN